MVFEYQRTLKNQVSCFGVGLHTGLTISMTLMPAPEDTGIVFIRSDVNKEDAYIPADYLHVTNTMLGTTVANDQGVKVGTIEHLMAALWGCGIDNAWIEIDGPEIPIMDGSSEPFVFLIECAGVYQQSKTRRVIEVLKPIDVYEGDAFMTLQPAEGFSVSLEIDFHDQVIAKQACVFEESNLSFKTNFARARTFGFAHEVDKLRSLGFARGGSLDNAIVVSGSKVLNEGGLRYKDEFVRHKIVDCIGDLYLAGGYLKGHFHGVRSGHSLNNKLLRAFFADHSAWRVLQWPEMTAQAS